MPVRIIALTALSLVAFAANSLLCRFALAQHRIDAGSFTAIRLVSGAVVLGLLALRSLRKRAWPGSAASTFALFLYAAPFSFAYLRLGAGMGALVLFASVQATMIGVGVARGEKSSPTVFAGLALAFAGLIGLAAPGASAPDALGVTAMCSAGIAWGIYSLRGRVSSAPALATTAANFIGCVPLALVLLGVTKLTGQLSISYQGAVLAIASGALASGVGYSIWYSALPQLSATRAAVVQLLVPIIALAGGVVLLREHASTRLLLAGTTILCGVALALRAARERTHT